jgi:hypothetical protein
MLTAYQSSSRQLIGFCILRTNATMGRSARAREALAAGKHVYLEKPIAEHLEDALDLARRAERAGVKNGVVQDKLFLPGLLKLRKLYDANFFGGILSIRLDFGWWVFDGMPYPAQRPSWNYRKATAGGLILDMFAHWRYIFDRLLGEIKSVSCRRALAGGATQGRPQTHRPRRWRTAPGAQLPHPAGRSCHAHPQRRPPRARSPHHHPRHPHPHTAPRPRSARRYAHCVDRPKTLLQAISMICPQKRAKFGLTGSLQRGSL